MKLPSGPAASNNDVRTKIDPDTQARLEALLEAAGKALSSVAQSEQSGTGCAVCK